MNHNFSPDDITDEGVDPLNLKLHKFSRELETLGIDGMTFGNELFWPPKTNDIPPSWLNLKIISIDYMSTTPSGEWLFVGRPGHDEDD